MRPDQRIHTAEHDPVVPPRGLRLLTEVISEKEETDVVARIEQLPLSWERPILRRGLLPAKREMVCFGWRYVTHGRHLEPGFELPQFLRAVRDRCAVAVALDPLTLEQCIITRYAPGAGINWHSDAPVFGPVVLTTSLLTDWRMDFNRGGSSVEYSVSLPRRSLLVLEGEARALWRHRISPVKSTRYSISFRSLSGLNAHRGAVQ